MRGVAVDGVWSRIWVQIAYPLGHAHWADWMIESSRRLQQRDSSGVTHLLGAYGRMGSFCDILPELFGEQPDNDVNRARKLRSEAWDLAHQVIRGAESA